MRKNNDHYTDQEYIRNLFENDGIKAPESLSEENIMAMLKDLPEQPAEKTQPESVQTPEDAFTVVTAKKRRPVKKWMAAAACALIAVIGAVQIYDSLTAPPDTAVVNGELYTFKNRSEIEHLISSLDESPRFGLNYKTEDGIVEDAEMASGDSAVSEASPDVSSGAGTARAAEKSAAS